MATMVITSLGEVPESDLKFEIIKQESGPEVWLIAHEGRYFGSQFPEARGTVVRRDVWCIQKVGHGAAAAQG